MKTNKCPVFAVTGLLGRKWTVVLIQEIELHGDRGFNYLFKRFQTISPKILSRRLDELEQNGLVSRKVVGGKAPVRTRYALTKKGAELNLIITTIKEWSHKYSKNPPDCPTRECVTCPLYCSK